MSVYSMVQKRRKDNKWFAASANKKEYHVVGKYLETSPILSSRPSDVSR